MSTPRQIILPPPFPYQQEVLDDDHRFKVLDVGRQAGKTTGCGLALCYGHGPKQPDGLPLFHGMLQGQIGFWIAPTYEFTEIAFRRIREWFAPVWGSLDKCETFRKQWIAFPGGGRIHMRSAEDPEKLVGETLGFVVIDEAAKCKAGTWDLVQPALTVAHTLRVRGIKPGGGWAKIISTPKGRQQWFYKYFKMGQVPDPDYKSWCWPSTISPLFSKEEDARYRKQWSDNTALYEQEILARFVVSDGSFFRRKWFQMITLPDQVRKDYYLIRGELGVDALPLSAEIARLEEILASGVTGEIREMAEQCLKSARRAREPVIPANGEAFLTASLPIDEESRGEPGSGGVVGERHLVVATWNHTPAHGLIMTGLIREKVQPAAIPERLSEIGEKARATFLAVQNLEPLNSMAEQIGKTVSLYPMDIVGVYDVPGPIDDAERVAPAAAMIKAGRMRFVEADWNEDFLGELFCFPDPEEERSCVQVCALAASVRT